MESIDILTDKVLEKDALRELDRSYAKKVLKDVLRRHKRDWEDFSESQNVRSQSFKNIYKAARTALHEAHGVYYNTAYPPQRLDVLAERAGEGDEEALKALLKAHRSTSERLDDYEYLYSQLEDFFEGISSVADIGCGYNPYAAVFFDDVGTYNFSDMYPSELRRMEKFLDKRDISGTGLVTELSGDHVIEICEGVDVCLFFKFFDDAEKFEEGFGNFSIETSLNNVKKGIIASFSTRTISGKKMNQPTRTWFKNWLKEHDNKTYVVETSNEIYYAIKK